MPAHAGKQKYIDQALKMTPGSAKALVAIKDDSLDITAEISSYEVFQIKSPHLENDSFLRAFVNKKTGVADIQVYLYVLYSGGWRLYNSAFYEYSDGPREAKFIPISQEVLTCSAYGYGNNCSYVEQMAFSISENELRSIAALYAPGQQNAWKFKLKSKSGNEFPDGLLPAEVAGFLMALDEYRSAHNLPPPSPTPPTP